jgi:ligand-binding sensor domain-containing protein
VRSRWARATRAIALAALVAPRPASAAVDRFAQKAFGTADGLSQSGVNAIAQDGDGYLWIATQDGLDRFDGARFTRWFVDDGLPSNVVDDVFVDARGRVWIGTEAGVAVRDERGIHPVAMPPAFAGGKVHGFVETAGAVWCAANEDLLRVDDGLRASIAPRDDVPPVTSLARARDGALLAGTRAGLFRFTVDAGGVRAHERVHPESAPLASLRVWSLLATARGDVWLAGEDGGLLVLDAGGAVRALGPAEGLTTRHVSALAAAGDDVLVSTFDDGLYRATASGGGWRARSIAAAGHRVATATIDAEGTLWIGDFTDGALVRFEAAKFATVTTADGMPSNEVYGMQVVNARDAAIGTAMGLAIVDTESLVTRSVLTPGVEFTSIAPYADGTGFCAGTVKHGAYCTLGGSITSADGLPGETVNDLVFDPSGALWLATSNGVAIAQHGKIVRTFGLPDGLLEARVFALHRDREGAIWIGYSSRTGVSVWRGDRFEHYGAKEGLPRGGVTEFLEDKRGRLWIATDGGVARREPDGRFRTFSKKEGLPSDEVYVALEDDDGAIWLSTDDGVAEIRDDRVVATFTTDDGLAANEGQSHAGAKDSAGRLWFGSTGGVTVIDPHHIAKNDVPPRVVIESARFARDNDVRFEFTATSFREPRAMRFAYRLDGFDRDWTELAPPVALRAASYTNLPPGDYAFEVKATNNDGVWSKEPAVHRFRIAAPWWRAPWVFALGAASLVWLGYGATVLRVRRLRARADELEAKVQARTRELEEKNVVLDRQLAQLTMLNAELVESQKRAERIFGALTDALPGTVLDGRYRLEERIGAGGFGVVFRATHLDLKRAVAVKVFRPQPGNDSAEAMERFRREAVSACRVKHENAVAVYDSGISSDGILYLVMELLDGETLADLLARTPRLEVRRSLEIARSIAAALDAAHAEGIVHRDVKPENVVLHRAPEASEVVKVVDFGVARFTGTELSRDGRLTQTDAIIGTPAYIAPERLTGGAYDGRSDVYSVGVILYQCLSGRLPVHCEEETLVARIMKQVNEEPRAIRDHVPWVDAGVAEIVMRAVQRRPESRPDARELEEALDLALATLATTGGRDDVEYRPGDATIPPPAEKTIVTRGPR